MTRCTARTKVLLAILLLLATAVPMAPYDFGDAAECEPVCDSCHYAHDRVYHAYMDITRFDAPVALDGADRKQVEVQLRLHGNVGLGYTTISRGWVHLTAAKDRIAIDEPRQDYVSFAPGFRSFFWNVSGRLEGTDTLHVDAYGLGVHLNVEFRESADSGTVSVTNPVNADPRVTLVQPDGYDDVASNRFDVELLLDDPNADHLLVDLHYDTDRDRGNGMTLIVRDLLDPSTYRWDTRGLPNGWYYLHLDADDQRGGTFSTTAEHPVIVSHQNMVPNVELLDPPIPSGSPPEPYVVRDPVHTFRWYAEDGDGDPLSFEFYVGRDPDHLELVTNTTSTSLDYRPDDNALLYYYVIPNDGQIRGWSRSPPRPFLTDIEYPVEVDLVLPANGSVVPGPDVKLVWYGRDLDYQQVLYSVFLETGGDVTRVASRWDDPAGPVLTVPDLVPGTTYSWWVEGDNPYSKKGRSETWSFTVGPGGVPVALLQEEEVDGGRVTLRWTPSPAGPRPSTYDLHLVDPAGGDRVVREGTTETSAVLDDLSEDTRYHWYVVPRDAQGSEGLSDPAFRTFTYDTNAPPWVTIDEAMAEVSPGEHTLRWSGGDPDGDDVTFDVYLDALNATTLVAANTTSTELVVTLEPRRIYRWRVVPGDGLSIGTGAAGVVVVGGQGANEGATGRLLSPEDGDRLEGPVVNLTWEAQDTLGRLLLFDLYIDLEGEDPLLVEPLADDLTAGWWLLEVPLEAEVRWAVTARPLGGPVGLLGTASFHVSEDAAAPPVARLSLGGGAVGAPVSVRALEQVELFGNASTGGGDLEYWFEFGDGRSSGWVDMASLSHTYLEAGTYNASLVVRDARGLVSARSVVSVEVLPGRLGSDEDVPAPGAAWALVALVACAFAVAARQRHLGGGG